MQEAKRGFWASAKLLQLLQFLNKPQLAAWGSGSCFLLSLQNAKKPREPAAVWEQPEIAMMASQALLGLVQSVPKRQ